MTDPSTWPTTRISTDASGPLRIPEPGGPPPPLPDPIASRLSLRQSDEQVLNDQLHTLRHGCYLVRYTPVQATPGINSIHYDGTMRVERSGGNVTASGDLYLHQIPPFTMATTLPVPPAALAEPNPVNGVPIFPRDRYRYYVRIVQILEGTTTEGSFLLGFELHRFTAATSSWTNEGKFTAKMKWEVAPANFSSGTDYLSGNVENSAGITVGSLTMGWVSSYLRKAILEIDRVSQSEPPLGNGAGVSWKNIFDRVGWELTVTESNADITEISGESWSDAEMHAAMLARRDTTDLDTQWRYHVLCVRKIDSTPRGIMYDNGATDSNKIPREGAGIASHWIVPDEPPWGRIKGVRFGTATGAYFRTAVHEIGHAMGLYHNTTDFGVMNTTDVIAESAIPPVQFPDNIQWSHAPDDQKRLRHMPDIWVRPGGTVFGMSYTTTPISPDDLIQDMVGLTLEVTPLLSSVPIGAPVRVNFALINHTGQPLPAPSNLSLKSGFVRGKVVDPSGTVRSFLPIVLCMDEHPVAMLAPEGRVENSITLLRGPEGALFPAGGMYRVSVEVTWEVGGATVGVVGETSVMVTSAQTTEHSDAALKILSTPDAVLTLALGGDHLTEGVTAIKTGLDNATLRPHYAWIEAKRIGTRFLKREADLNKSAALLTGDAVLSSAEIRRATELIQQPGGMTAKAKKEVVHTLKAKVEATDVTATTREMVERL